MIIGGIILAAGKSSRMGSFKPLLPCLDKTIIECTVLSLLEGGVDSIIVVTGKNAIDVERTLEKYPVKTVRNNDYELNGMIDSIKIGLKNLLDTDAMFILPGDIPNIKPSTIVLLKEAFNKGNYEVIIPRFNGIKGHPPIVSQTCYQAILEYKGTDGLREVFASYIENTAFIDIEDEGIILDIDYKSDYDKLLNKLT